jgi:hypothetical protein
MDARVCFRISRKLVKELDRFADMLDIETWTAEKEFHQLSPLSHVSEHRWTEETGLKWHTLM